MNVIFIDVFDPTIKVTVTDEVVSCDDTMIIFSVDSLSGTSQFVLPVGNRTGIGGGSLLPISAGDFFGSIADDPLDIVLDIFFILLTTLFLSCVAFVCLTQFGWNTCYIVVDYCCEACCPCCKFLWNPKRDVSDETLRLLDKEFSESISGLVKQQPPRPRKGPLVIIQQPPPPPSVQRGTTSK